MPYITVRQTPKHHQLSYEDVISNAQPAYAFTFATEKPLAGTITRFVEQADEELILHTPVSGLIAALKGFNTKHQVLREAERHSLYHEFYIPKRTGGLRKISAPNEPLMNALRELVGVFTEKFGALYHTSAFAYVPGRSTIDAIKRHQANDSKWFLKTDCSDFFGSTSKEFVMRMLSVIFPFSEVMKHDDGRAELEAAIDLCTLDGGLPQGTPISPMLTNLVMIPIDHRISNILRKDGFVYTRYADDMQISSKRSFMFTAVVKTIEGVFAEFQAPYTLKPKKTRYGSRNGANWNLGVMLNKDNKITIGDRKRDNFRAMAANFIESIKENRPWDIRDIQIFSGLISYYMMVEREFVINLKNRYEQKFGIDFIKAARDALK